VRAVVRAWHSDREDAGRGVVRTDGQLRESADVRVDDRVTLEPAAVSDVETIELTAGPLARFPPRSARTKWVCKGTFTVKRALHRLHATLHR